MSITDSIHATVEGAAPKPLRWTTAQYYGMGEMGWFDGKRVELIDGEIVEMSPTSSRHAAMAAKINPILQGVFECRHHVRHRCPLDLGEGFQPDPDLAIIHGNALDYLEGHPTTAVLVIEVSDSTLEYDRVDKSSLYARAGIQEYWIINLIEELVEVYRQPSPRPHLRFGFGYQELTTYGRGDSISPLAAPTVSIPVASLLP